MKKLNKTSKVEKRRLAFEKRNVKKEKNFARYGAEGGSALVMAKATAFNRRFVAAFLAFVFVITCLVVGNSFVGRANDSQANMKPAGASGAKDDASGMVVNKYLQPNNDGKYDLKIEAYSTKEMQPITEKIPTDFVVVVDQSGSMDTEDMPMGDPTLQNDLYLEDVANGRYYYKEGENYYRVYGVKDYLYQYYPANYWYVGDILERVGADLSWFQGEKEESFGFDNQFYWKEGDDYRPIKLTIAGKVGTYYNKFSYVNGAGQTISFNRDSTTYGNILYKNLLGQFGWGPTIDPGEWGYSAIDTFIRKVYRDENAYTYSEVNVLFGAIQIDTGMLVNYPMYDRHVGYTKLCYRDINGIEHEVPSDNNNVTKWEFCQKTNNGNIQAITTNDGSTRPTYSNLFTFSGSQRRIDALQNALTQFAQEVAEEKDSFGAVDNKVSIIGFSSDENTYANTELLTGNTFEIERGSRINSNYGYSADGYNHNGKLKSQATTADYAGALVGATNGNVGTINSKITNAISAITAYGGTQPEDGLNMAYQVLTNRGDGEGKTTYKIRSGPNEGDIVDRNTIVIFFTDGQPGNYHESNQYSEANDVVAQAQEIKNYGKTLDHGTTVFTIGVFGESDGNPLTYDGRNDWTKDNQGRDVRVGSLDRANWEYLGGWVETYRDGNTYYCLRRQWRPSSEGYTESPNDTIYDYMSVVSSNYPDAENYIAPAWLAGNFNGTYIDATDGDTVRHKSTAVKNSQDEYENRYYRMASNQDTLVAAFMQAVTMNNDEAIETEVDLSGNALIKDILSADFVVDTQDGKPVITCETVKCTMDGDKNVTEDSGEGVREDITDQLGADGIVYDSGTKTISIKGFSYTDNYIANPKRPDAAHDLGENQGKKLVVTIKNVYPNSTVTSKDDIIYSNNTTSGLFVPDEDEGAGYKKLMDLPRPSISRHSYTLDVGSENTSGKFNVVSTIVDSSGATVPINDSSLKNVIVASGGTRSLYSSSGGTSVANSKKDDVFYYENVPDGYKVKTSVTAQENQYTYTMYANEDTGNTSELRTDAATDRTLNYEDSILHITSVANTRSVTIRETVDGSFANDTDKFTPTLYLVPPEGQQVPAEGATYSGINWEIDGTNNRLKYTTRAILGNNDDSVSLTVPANWKLVVEQTDSDNYEVTDKEYVLGTSGTSTDIPAGGVDITDNLTITITNTRDNIPITGVDDHDTYNWVIYLLAAIAGIAVIGAGIFFWKKKDEFVEE